jgi:hypothetical protein
VPARLGGLGGVLHSVARWGVVGALGGRPVTR